MVFNLRVNYWIECLAPPERGAFDLLHGYHVLSINDVPRAAYDALWVTQGGLVGSDRYDLWLARCGASLVVIEDPPGVFTEYYRINPVFWAQVSVALLEPPPADYPCIVSPPWT